MASIRQSLVSLYRAYPNNSPIVARWPIDYRALGL